MDAMAAGDAAGDRAGWLSQRQSRVETAEAKWSVGHGRKRRGCHGASWPACECTGCLEAVRRHGQQSVRGSKVQVGALPCHAPLSTGKRRRGTQVTDQQTAWRRALITCIPLLQHLHAF